MTKHHPEQHVLYMPDSPNVGDVNPAANADDPDSATKDRVEADALAAKVSTGDELSAYEKVAGRGVPKR